MKNYIITLLLIFSITATAQKNFIDQNYIEVNGKAEKEIVPNEIYLRIIISESDNKAKEPLELLEKNMLKKLESLGIDLKKQLAVKDMSSNFKNYWLKKQDIVTSKEYELMVDKASTAGKVFRELEALGISNMDVVRIDHSEMDRFKNELKAEAIVKSRATAEQLTAPLNQKVGRALFIRENEPFMPYRATENMMMKVSSMVLDQNYQEPELEFEKIKIVYAVQVYFLLE
ncbi:MAG: SIMPL domain-containing protein [Prolixibacteraceae bacterium]|nr:SIMPL domain-containing protein [Prolixibacteraceae bacterium]